MIRRDSLHRLAGVGLLLGSGACTLLYREIWRVHAAGPATAMEAALGLATFVLASFGLLLVTGGAQFRDGWKRDCDRAARRRQRRAAPGEGASDSDAADRRILAHAMDPTASAGGRPAISALLLLRARQADRMGARSVPGRGGAIRKQRRD